MDNIWIIDLIDDIYGFGPENVGIMVVKSHHYPVFKWLLNGYNCLKMLG